MADLEIGTLITKFVADITGIESGVNEYSQQMDKAAEATQKAQESSNEYAKQTDKTTEATSGLNTESINLAASLANAQTLYNYSRQALGVYTDAFVDAYGAVSAFNRMTGTTVEQGGKWNQIMEENKLELGNMTMAFRMLSMNVQAAQDGTGRAADAFRALHVNIYNANGQLKDSNTIMLETMSALAKVQNAGERNALAQDTIGRAQMNINKLWADGKDMMDIYSKTQTEMTANGMHSYKEYAAASGKMEAAISDLKVEIGMGLIPILTNFAKFVTDTLIPAVDKVTERLQYMGYVVAGLGSIVAGKSNIDDIKNFQDFHTMINTNIHEPEQPTSSSLTRKATPDDIIRSQWGSAGIPNPSAVSAGGQVVVPGATGTQSLTATALGQTGVSGVTGSGGATEGPSDEFILAQGESGIKAAVSKGMISQSTADRYILIYRDLLQKKITEDYTALQEYQKDLVTRKEGTQEYNDDVAAMLRISKQTQLDIEKTGNKELLRLWKELGKDIESNPINAVIDTTQIGTALSTPAGGVNAGQNPFTTPPASDWSQGGTQSTGAQFGRNVGSEGSPMNSFMRAWYNKNITYQEAMQHWIDNNPVGDFSDQWKGTTTPSTWTNPATGKTEWGTGPAQTTPAQTPTTIQPTATETTQPTPTLPVPDRGGTGGGGFGGFGGSGTPAQAWSGLWSEGGTKSQGAVFDADPNDWLAVSFYNFDHHYTEYAAFHPKDAFSGAQQKISGTGGRTGDITPETISQTITDINTSNPLIPAASAGGTGQDTGQIQFDDSPGAIGEMFKDTNPEETASFWESISQSVGDVVDYFDKLFSIKPAGAIAEMFSGEKKEPLISGVPLDEQIKGDIEATNAALERLKSEKEGTEEFERDVELVKRNAAMVEKNINKTNNDALKTMWMDTKRTIKDNPIAAIMDIKLVMYTVDEKGNKIPYTPGGGGGGGSGGGGGGNTPGRWSQGGTKSGGAAWDLTDQYDTESHMNVYRNAYAHDWTFSKARDAIIREDYDPAWNTPNARASGGPVLAGEPYLVGEAGPELFKPDTNGSIVPNNMISTQQTANIYVELDSQIIAQKIAAPLVGEIRVRTGLR